MGRLTEVYFFGNVFEDKFSVLKLDIKRIFSRIWPALQAKICKEYFQGYY